MTFAALSGDWRRPDPGTQYPQLLRDPGTEWWRVVAAILGALVGYVVLVGLIVQAVIGAEYGLSGDQRPWPEFYKWSVGFHSPWGLLGAHLGIASLTLVAMAMVALFLRSRPGWLSSVAGRLRWGWLVTCAVISVVLVAVSLMVMSWAQHAPLYVRPQSGFVGFLVVIVVTTPLQAAAEEYLFRGLFLQATGALSRSPWVGIVASAALFALFHGTQNLALLTDRFAFGILAGVLVWKTGGLEAAIAAHVMNNVFAFIQAAVTTSVATARALQEASWSMVAWHLGVWAVIAAVLYVVARWRRIPTVVAVS